VSQERPSERARGKPARSPARGITRGAAAAPRRAKRRGGFWANAGALLAAMFNPRRPVVAVTMAVALLAAIVVLIGVVVPRAVAKTSQATDALVSEAGFGLAAVHLSGNVRTAPEEILAALHLKAGQSLFGIDLAAARTRLLTLPWIANAEIRRRYPDDIAIRIVERVPYARWQLASGPVVVESGGRIITADAANRFDKLPLLVGDGAPAHARGFLEDVARHRVIVKRVLAYEFRSGRRWNLLLDNGIVVKLPEKAWDVQLEYLDKLIVEDGILEADIREIDLRSTSSVFVKTREAPPKEKKTETGRAI